MPYVTVYLSDSDFMLWKQLQGNKSQKISNFLRVSDADLEEVVNEVLVNAVAVSVDNIVVDAGQMDYLKDFIRCRLCGGAV